MPITIKAIRPDKTFEIRHKVMWPNKPIDYVKLANDNEGKHYGLFLNDKIVSVISLFIKNDEAQFRKFATLNEHQGKGYGSKLLTEIFNIALENNIKRIWCNARIDKTNYYAKFNMIATQKTFVKGGITYVIMEKIMA